MQTCSIALNATPTNTAGKSFASRHQARHDRGGKTRQREQAEKYVDFVVIRRIIWCLSREMGLTITPQNGSERMVKSRRLKEDTGFSLIFPMARAGIRMAMVFAPRRHVATQVMPSHRSALHCRIGTGAVGDNEK